MVRIEGTTEDEGHHAFSVRCLGPDGSVVLRPVEGEFDFPPEGGAVCFSLQMQATFGQAGAFDFVLDLDGNRVHSCQIQAVLRERVPQ